MKKTIKFLVAAFSLSAVSTGLFAQASASASVAATIVTPVSITKTIDMNFGNVAASGTAGTVVLTPAGGRSTTGGVTLPTTAGTVAAASFTVAGTPNYTYTITLPAGATTIGDGATHTMTVGTWTSSPTPTGNLGAGGSQTLTVGATLNVGANQASGSYSSAVASGGTGDFTVTVNYN